MLIYKSLIIFILCVIFSCRIYIREKGVYRSFETKLSQSNEQLTSRIIAGQGYTTKILEKYPLQIWLVGQYFYLGYYQIDESVS